MSETTTQEAPRLQMGSLEVVGGPQDRAKLFGKLAKVLAAMTRVPKSGRNTQQNYSYATEGDALDVVRPALAEAGLSLLVSTERVERTEGKSRSGGAWFTVRVSMRYTLCCGDTGAMATAVFEGEGQDSMDKALYKAYTGASKYYVLKTFMLATGDDPERDAEDGPAPRGRRSERQAEPEPTPSPDSLLAEIDERLKELPMRTAGRVGSHDVPCVSSFVAANLERIRHSEKLGAQALEALNAAVMSAKKKAKSAKPAAAEPSEPEPSPFDGDDLLPF